MSKEDSLKIWHQYFCRLSNVSSLNFFCFLSCSFRDPGLAHMQTAARAQLYRCDAAMWSGQSHRTCTRHVSRSNIQTNCLASTRCWKTHLLTKFLRFVRLVLVMTSSFQHLSFRNTTSARETHFSFADEPNTPISSDWKEAPTFSLQQLLAPNRGSRYLPPAGGIFFPRWVQIRGKHW